MLTHTELEQQLKGSVTPTQYKILEIIISYDQGWMSERELEKQLREVFKPKRKK